MGQLLKQVAASLSMQTYTPIPYWLSLPLEELCSWVETIHHLKKKEG